MSPPAASSRDGQPVAAATATGSVNLTLMRTESPAERSALAFEADTPATAGRTPSIEIDAECESDPGEPGAGSARLAGFPAASATAAPLGESAPAPAYDRPSE